STSLPTPTTSLPLRTPAPPPPPVAPIRAPPPRAFTASTRAKLGLLEAEIAAAVIPPVGSSGTPAAKHMPSPPLTPVPAGRSVGSTVDGSVVSTYSSIKSSQSLVSSQTSVGVSKEVQSSSPVVLDVAALVHAPPKPPPSPVSLALSATRPLSTAVSADMAPPPSPSLVSQVLPTAKTAPPTDQTLSLQPTATPSPLSQAGAAMSAQAAPPPTFSAQGLSTAGRSPTPTASSFASVDALKAHLSSTHDPLTRFHLVRSYSVSNPNLHPRDHAQIWGLVPFARLSVGVLTTALADHAVPLELLLDGAAFKISPGSGATDDLIVSYSSDLFHAVVEHAIDVGLWTHAQTFKIVRTYILAHPNEEQGPGLFGKGIGSMIPSSAGLSPASPVKTTSFFNSLLGSGSSKTNGKQSPIPSAPGKQSPVPSMQGKQSPVPSTSGKHSPLPTSLSTGKLSPAPSNYGTLTPPPGTSPGMLSPVPSSPVQPAPSPSPTPPSGGLNGEYPDEMDEEEDEDDGEVEWEVKEVHPIGKEEREGAALSPNW
ncbi:hypothetical protein HDU93_004613, partial [Gonapodya sp. JEL0774]